MTRESTEELRARLLRDHEVLEMIRMRAYEIYQHRGDAPGSSAEDWFQAEGEVLYFLIEEESRHASETATASESAPATPPQADPVEAPPKKTGARKTKASSENASDGVAKKTSSRRTAAKKTADAPAKPKRSRKKSKDLTPVE